MYGLQITLQRGKTRQLAWQEAEQAWEGFSTWTHYHIMQAWTASAANSDSIEQERSSPDCHSWKGEGKEGAGFGLPD